MGRKVNQVPKVPGAVHGRGATGVPGGQPEGGSSEADKPEGCDSVLNWTGGRRQEAGWLAALVLFLTVPFFGGALILPIKGMDGAMDWAGSTFVTAWAGIACCGSPLILAWAVWLLIRLLMRDEKL